MTRRGQPRVYLGSAPGVGKTFAMLDEGHRRSARDTDVVVAYVETHGRLVDELAHSNVPGVEHSKRWQDVESLLWLADGVDEGLQRYREQHGIHNTWETRERVVVALTGGPEGEVLIRRASLGNEVGVRVIDRGPGIPPDDRERAFKPLQRRDDKSTSTGAGVGLGLAIARGFVEAMHGTITSDAAPGGGLIVAVTLPIAPAPAPV